MTVPSMKLQAGEIRYEDGKRGGGGWQGGEEEGKEEEQHDDEGEVLGQSRNMTKGNWIICEIYV